MASAIRPKRRHSKPTEPEPAIPPLENGDHLDQKTFHERYEAMPEDTRAELIGGIVYMGSPLKRPHGRHHLKLGTWLTIYEEATPGTEAHDSTTTILDPDNEPQPDLSLVIVAEGFAQTHDVEEYIAGAPELVLEIASSTEAIDLHRKETEYEKAGVKEYVVAALRQKRVFWFVVRRGKFEELAAGADGIYRSKIFPGLWLDPAAFFGLSATRMLEVLQQGLDSPEHAAFVKKLAGK